MNEILDNALSELSSDPRTKLFAVYDGTGHIVRHGETRDPIENQAFFSGETAVEIEERPSDLGSTFYYVDGVLTPRPTVALSALPIGTEFEVLDTTGEYFVGVLDSVGLEIDRPGEWRVSARPPWPYQEIRDETVVVD